MCVVAALVATLAWTVPAAAQPGAGLPLSWSSFAGRVLDWATGVWRMVAGSETEPAEPGVDNPDLVALDGAGDQFETGEPEGDRHPMIDPDG